MILMKVYIPINNEKLKNKQISVKHTMKDQLWEDMGARKGKSVSSNPS